MVLIYFNVLCIRICKYFDILFFKYGLLWQILIQFYRIIKKGLNYIIIKAKKYNTYVNDSNKYKILDVKYKMLLNLTNWNLIF